MKATGTAESTEHHADSKFFPLGAHTTGITPNMSIKGEGKRQQSSWRREAGWCPCCSLVYACSMTCGSLAKLHKLCTSGS